MSEEPVYVGRTVFARSARRSICAARARTIPRVRIGTPVWPPSSLLVPGPGKGPAA